MMTTLSRIQGTARTERELKKATIADVARAADVSIKTVSRVVNREPNVRDATRDRVERAIDDLNYRPNTYARSLAGSRSYLIGLLYDNPSPSYLVNVQGGALNATRAASYDLIIHPCSYQSSKLADDLTGTIQHSRLDGVVLTPPLSDMKSVAAVLDDLGTPYVRIAPAEPAPVSDAVMTNDREACAAMTRYLASLGHRRIGFVVGHPDHGAVGTRYTGFQIGLEDSGIDLDEDLIEQGYNSFESGVEAGRALLAKKKRPTAIFASNDDMAAGIMKVAHELGISVPGELSVAGFDDVPLASYVWPSLTTIRQPIRAMAERATEVLLLRLAGRSTDDLPRVIESELIVRDSTGPAPTG